MAKTTPATLALTRAGATFEVHTYDYDPEADRVGLQAAQALGADPERVLKTLLTLVDDKPACVILRSDRTVDMKALARALGGKSARMAPVADAERMTGYKVGGVSPFGQKRTCRTVLDRDALRLDQVFVNGGGRGLQVLLAPQEIVRVAQALVAEVSI